MENGKTLAESRAEIRRGIENVEVACGIPTLMQGYNLEDVARGIDETMIRQPLGVTRPSRRSTFPVMIPFWFLPYAIACGNTFILKPSERVPLAMQHVFELMEELDLPPGVLNMVNGGEGERGRAAGPPAGARHQLRGSTPVAKYIYAQGGRKRQARAVPGWRQEPRGGAAGRRPGNGDARSSATAPSAARASAAWPYRWR